jgi:hypothetical protein
VEQHDRSHRLGRGWAQRMVEVVEREGHGATLHGRR